MVHHSRVNHVKGYGSARVPRKPTKSILSKRPIPRRSFLGLTGGMICMQNMGGIAQAQAVDELQAFKTSLTERVHEFQLSNGLHFIVVPRRVAPIVSCLTYASVGALDDPVGQSGVSHLLEHLAFKGTSRLGCLNFEKEQQVLRQQDEVFYEMRDAQDNKDYQKVKRLSSVMQQLQKQETTVSEPNAYGKLLTTKGAVGLNAFTSYDCTEYFLSLPANQLQLWMALEAERFRAPVLRQLYREKNVVLEERKDRLAAPLAEFEERYQQVALPDKYSRPVIGELKDIQRLGRVEVAEHFAKNYGPKNLTIAIVGDVDPDQVATWAEQYFGGWEAPGGGREAPMCLPKFENRLLDKVKYQATSRGMRLTTPAGPKVVVGYYTPPTCAEFGTQINVISSLLDDGRRSLFFKNLIEPGLAYSASCEPSFPSQREDSLVLVEATPGNGVKPDELVKKVQQLAKELGEGSQTEATLSRIRKEALNQLYSSMQSQFSIGGALAASHATMGTWRGLLDDVDTIMNMTVDDVTRISNIYFQADNAFVGIAEKGQKSPVVLF